MTKSRTFGVMTIPGSTRYIDRVARNGTVVRNNVSTNNSVSRRLGESSVISYQTGNDSRYRPCRHVKTRYMWLVRQPNSSGMSVKCPPGSQLQFDTGFFAVSGFAEQVYASSYSNFAVRAESGLPSLSGLQWETLASGALQNLLPSFNTGKASLVNQILELRDFKRLGLSLVNRINGKQADIFGALLGLKPRHIPRNNGKRVRRSLKDYTLKDLSSMYLGYNFAWAPLLGDIQGLVKTFKDFESKYARIIKEAGVPVTRRYQTLVPGTSTPSLILHEVESSGIGGWVGNCSPTARTRVYIEASKGVTYSACIRMVYDIPPDLRSYAGKAKAFLDALGVSRNPAILWNAIPFTFIIDWVVGVSSWLETLRVDNVVIPTKILDFCHSAKVGNGVQFQMSKRLQICNPGYNSWSRSWDAYETTDWAGRTVYERRVGIPNLRSALALSGLNWREFTLGGALIHVRR